MKLVEDLVRTGMETWAGTDNSPGTLSWDEWKRLTGESSDTLRTLCTVGEADVLRAVLAGEPIGDEADVIALADRLWGEQIEKDFDV